MYSLGGDPALVPRTRSSHHNCRESDCELQAQSGTRIIELLVSFDSEVRSGACVKLRRTSESGQRTIERGAERVLELRRDVPPACRPISSEHPRVAARCPHVLKSTILHAPPTAAFYAGVAPRRNHPIFRTGILASNEMWAFLAFPKPSARSDRRVSIHRHELTSG